MIPRGAKEFLSAYCVSALLSKADFAMPEFDKDFPSECSASGCEKKRIRIAQADTRHAKPYFTACVAPIAHFALSLTCIEGHLHPFPQIPADSHSLGEPCIKVLFCLHAGTRMSRLVFLSARAAVRVTLRACFFSVNVPTPNHSLSFGLSRGFPCSSPSPSSPLEFFPPCDSIPPRYEHCIHLLLSYAPETHGAIV